MEGVVHLVEHGGLELVQFIGAPPQADLLLQLLMQIVALQGVEPAALLQLLDETGHPPLFVTHGVAHDFGGVGREHQAQVEVAQQGFQLGRRHVEAAQALEQLAEGGRFALAGQGRQEGIGDRGLVDVLEAVEVAVLLDVLLEDVHQLEIEREGPGRGNRLGQIHLPDQLHDGGARLAAGLGQPLSALGGVAEMLETQQSLGLIRGALAQQHCLPEIFHQLQAFTQQSGGPGGGFGNGRHELPHG